MCGGRGVVLIVVLLIVVWMVLYELWVSMMMRGILSIVIVYFRFVMIDLLIICLVLWIMNRLFRLRLKMIFVVRWELE